jgi:hypothetical protein
VSTARWRYVDLRDAVEGEGRAGGGGESGSERSFQYAELGLTNTGTLPQRAVAVFQNPDLILSTVPSEYTAPAAIFPLVESIDP